MTSSVRGYEVKLGDHTCPYHPVRAFSEHYRFMREMGGERLWVSSWWLRHRFFWSPYSLMQDYKTVNKYEEKKLLLKEMITYCKDLAASETTVMTHERCVRIPLPHTPLVRLMNAAWGSLCLTHHCCDSWTLCEDPSASHTTAVTHEHCVRIPLPHTPLLWLMNAVWGSLCLTHHFCDSPVARGDRVLAGALLTHRVSRCPVQTTGCGCTPCACPHQTRHCSADRLPQHHHWRWETHWQAIVWVCDIVARVISMVISIKNDNNEVIFYFYLFLIYLFFSRLPLNIVWHHLTLLVVIICGSFVLIEQKWNYHYSRYSCYYFYDNN